MIQKVQEIKTAILMTSFANVFPLYSGSSVEKVVLKQVTGNNLFQSKNFHMRCFQTNEGQEFYNSIFYIMYSNI